MPRFLAIALLFSHAALALADSRTLLVGGGATPASSEVSIEKNVAWILQILDRRHYNSYEVIFGNGDSSAYPDVKSTAPKTAPLNHHMPLARIFGDRKQLYENFRSNTVATSPLSSTRENVLERLGEILNDMTAGDELFLVYNGHGGSGRNRVDRAHLRLWNTTRLTVEDLSKALEKQPLDTSVRFVLPQCHSGPFLRLIHPSLDSANDNTVHAGRCGFVTVPHHRLSEGCTAVEVEARYRDYSTYFFAALDGQTRLGESLAADPDRNRNGTVDLQEAHYYAIAHSYSRDTPASTSEYYLERWEPWYSSWQSYDLPGDLANDFAGLARSLAGKIGQPEGLGLPARADLAARERSRLEQQIRELTTSQDSLRVRETALRTALQQEATLRWPQLRAPYGPAMSRMDNEQIEHLSKALRQLGGYRDLVQLQDEIDAIDDELLDLDRQLGMQMRMLRLIKLARLHHKLYRLGSEAEIANYEAIRQCEAWEGFGIDS